MGYLPHANSFRELVVYQKSRELAQGVFQLTKSLPRDEAYSLTDQLRRCSRSIGAQIAEAWAKRPYEKHFISKLTDAIGELDETQHWIDTAADCSYLKGEDTATLLRKCDEIGKLLGGMIAKAELFCTSKANVVREEMIEYFLENNH